MSTPPLLRVQINGILLSTLLFECANARVDYEGLILGAIVSKTRSVADDVSDDRKKTTYTTVVVQGVYKLEPNLKKFYGRSGEILEHVLEEYSIPSNLMVLGYLKYRRTESHQLSLRDKAVALNLKIYLEKKRALSSSPSNPFAPPRDEPFPVTMALFTAKTNENMSTHDYDYTFWNVGDDESSFGPISVETSNMIESPQEDYQSFQSNLAVGASRHAASVGMMNTVRTVPTTMLVDAHETMYKDSFEATKSLTRNVLESEQRVREILKEVEQLRAQVEFGKAKSMVDRQNNSASQHSDHQQQQYSSASNISTGATVTTKPSSQQHQQQQQLLALQRAQSPPFVRHASAPLLDIAAPSAPPAYSSPSPPPPRIQSTSIFPPPSRPPNSPPDLLY
ncbi:hypothetical protein K457DRAFT_133356 [Linnemannia elongata AG-77]|uniref:JAB1/MPN/MOV34 metalloenzyme domain-containing protein n=1 Tax=Linnemannia elongata AG-77 TaxID=1314771 RepID=A0A197KCM5_9FUNG|nr:hypothetical protein K457DRAFT_133356 [Linnemannia elongata AG-77]